MKWFWFAMHIVAAVIVWDIDNVILLRAAVCFLLIGAACSELLRAIPTQNGAR